MNKKILFSSVFKPFNVNDIYNRKASFTPYLKIQDVFAIRKYNPSTGLHLIANNIDTQSTVLEYPTLDRFKKEIKKGYDIIGISATLANITKVKRMIEEIRKETNKTTVIVGGFCAQAPDIEKMVGADYVCVGEGISFMRDFLGMPKDYEFKSPLEMSSELKELLGVRVFGVRTADIVVSLGCSYGCDFCSPHHFYGKRRISFFKTGQSLYDELLRKQNKFRTSSFSLIDENFLLDIKLAEELRECIIKSGRMFRIYLFGSANKISEFGPERLAELGADIVFLGRESRLSNYKKCRDEDIKKIVGDLRSFGIKTLLSSILLVDGHTKTNISEDIEEHITCHPFMSQFPQYSPLPGTEYYNRMKNENRIFSEIPYEEWHGFDKLWFDHPEFNSIEAATVQEKAYHQEYSRLGPSLLRYIETDLEGWENLRSSPNKHLRKRADFIAGDMWKNRIILMAVKHLSKEQNVKNNAAELLSRIEIIFGSSKLFEKTAAKTLYFTGSCRRIRNRFFKDTLEPSTKVTHYNSARH